MNRRGYIFSVLSIILVIIIFSVSSSQSERQQTQATFADSPILLANEFLEQFRRDVPRAVGITAYRSFLGLEEHISAQASFLESFEQSFSEVIMNGTVEQIPYDIMDDATLGVFLLRMQEIGAERNVDIDLRVANVTAYHITPFVVRVEVDIFLNASIPGARWEYVEVVHADFSVQDLKDPLFTVGTLGRVPRVIRASDVPSPLIPADNNVSGLVDVWERGLYVPTALAPTFLMRFEGNLSPHPLGVASLVDTLVIDSQDLVVFAGRSVVDHIYFGSVPSEDYTVYGVVNMPARFLLDDDHLIVFDAEDKTT